MMQLPLNTIKFLLKIFLACCLVVVLSLPVLHRASVTFLQDMIRLHGAAITGTALSVTETQLDWRHRAVHVDGMDIANPAVAGNQPNGLAAHLVDCTMRLSVLVQPDWHANGLMPPVLLLDSIGVGQLTLAYDIDTEGENLHALRTRLATVAGDVLRDRLNATANTSGASVENARQLFIVDSLKVAGIRIEGRSIQNPSRNKIIALGDIELRDVGRMENGITFEEIIDQLSRVLMDSVDREALAQGLIEIKPVAVPVQEESVVKKRRKIVREARDDVADSSAAEPAPQEGKTKRFFKEVGGGFKQVGKGIGNLFKRDK